MKRISYQSIAYSVTHSFLNDIIAKDYLYLEDKLNNINIEELSLVDKIFVVMCVNYIHKAISTKNYLRREYNIEVSEDDVFHVLLECQCSDIEITAMAKAFSTMTITNLRFSISKLIISMNMEKLICHIHMNLQALNQNNRRTSWQIINICSDCQSFLYCSII